MVLKNEKGFIARDYRIWAYYPGSLRSYAEICPDKLDSHLSSEGKSEWTGEIATLRSR